MYASPDNELIARMLHFPPEKNKLFHETNTKTVWAYTPVYEIDYRTVYNNLDQIWKDTDLYPYVKQHNSKRDNRGVIYVIHSRWLGPNHVNATASEAEMALQMSMYDGK